MFRDWDLLELKMIKNDLSTLAGIEFVLVEIYFIHILKFFTFI